MIIIADPPWRYSFSLSKANKIENQYPTLTVPEICALPGTSGFPELENNSALYLWATAPKLREALTVMDAWGFTYKSNMVWDKELLGMGYWARGQHEHVLIGTKGKHSPPTPKSRRSSVIRRKRGRHSVKPVDLHDHIDNAFPGETKVELFARDTRPGWITWGNEVGV